MATPNPILCQWVSLCLPGAGVPVLFGQPEVDQEELVAVPSDAHEEVVGFDVSMDERFAVDELDAADHLVGEHQHRLDREPAVAEVEEVLQGGPEQVHDQHIVLLFLAIESKTKTTFTHMIFST